MNDVIATDNELKAHLDAITATRLVEKGNQHWATRLEVFLARVRQARATPRRLQDRAFLTDIWNSNAIASTGAGHVRIEPALANAEFVNWFADAVHHPLPDNPLEAETHLTKLYNELKTRLEALCDRVPRLKLNRVLCAFYPDYFTTIANVGMLKYLHRRLGGNAHDHPVHMHLAIRARIDAALGPVAANDPAAAAQRLCLAWLLYERLTAEPETVEIAETELGLKPYPATLRRKGLTSIGGGLQTLLGLLPELDEGLSREEFEACLRQANPNLAASSVNTMLNVVAREFDLCKREGDTYRLSARGINLLETQNPDELADHLLTRVLGVDNLVKALAHAPQTKAELIAMLQTINPGWTTEYAPSSLIGWLSYFEVVEQGPNKTLRLTERGKRWAEMVTWEPGALPALPKGVGEVERPISGQVALPSFAALCDRLNAQGAKRLTFDTSLISQLHAGLWFHPVRHFAVLTGISGSGKTQLALSYANALCDVKAGDSSNVRIIPVQPGWYEPSPLLGYVNPVQASDYRGAPFLELLLDAVNNPDTPYVAILDEMNLSHPEQYLAPILSAMETQGWVDLHQLGDGTCATPMRVRYPSNLAIIGTLNMDETTHGLSDKVLDRAYTLEFWKIDVAAFPGWKTAALPDALKDKTQQVLSALVAALEPVRLHFGWRTIDDVLSYMAFQNTEGSDPQALDNVIYAKVLPKLRGETSQRFQTALEAVLATLNEHGLERCSQKVKSLQGDLIATGSARFWR